MFIAPLVFINTHEINETDSHRVEEFSETRSIPIRSASVLPSVVNCINSICRNEKVRHKGQRGNTGIYPQLFQVFRFKVNWWNHTAYGGRLDQ